MLPQQRQCDKMISTQGQHFFAGGKDPFGMVSQPCEHLFAVSGGEIKITAIDDSKFIKKLEIPRPTTRLPFQVSGCLPNGRRAETGPRPHSGCQIKGHAGDDYIHLRMQKIPG